jgi:hypothetical protein
MVQEDVGGLQVPVDDAQAMGVLQGVQNRKNGPGEGGKLEGPVGLEQSLEGGPVHQVHGVPMDAFLHPEVMDLDDPGMVQGGRHLGLVGKALRRLPLQGFAQDLQSFDAVQAQVPHFVDRAGSAPAQQVDELIAIPQPMRQEGATAVERGVCGIGHRVRPKNRQGSQKSFCKDNWNYH